MEKQFNIDLTDFFKDTDFFNFSSVFCGEVIHDDILYVCVCVCVKVPQMEMPCVNVQTYHFLPHRMNYVRIEE